MLVIGLNHRTAPVQVRERLAFSREGIATALMLFRSQFPSAEAAILSTCNRVELIIHSETGEVGLPEVMRFLAQARNVPVTDFREHLYHLDGRAAIRHVFRVISGLDSMVLGEYQIVNQLKQAYQLAHEQGTAGPTLHRLFHHAFGVSKRVRTETTVCDGKTSIPSVAMSVIRTSMPDFGKKRILVVGAGEMAQLMVEYLHKAEASDFIVTTRTLSNASALADVCGGRAVPFAQLDEQLAAADIIITATNCPSAILTRPRLAKAMEHRPDRPMLLIDLAVPRNIAADVVQLPGISLHDVDGLGQVVAESARQRATQMELCEAIIEEEVEGFEKWVAESKVRPLIERMYADVRALAEIELRALFRRCPDLSDQQKQAVEQLADRLVGKLMHPCVSTVRQQSMSSAASVLADAFRATRMSFAEAAK